LALETTCETFLDIGPDGFPVAQITFKDHASHLYNVNMAVTDFY